MLATKLPVNNTAVVLRQYKMELQQELNQLLKYWMDNVVDEKNGGFYGTVSNDNKPDESAPKGLVFKQPHTMDFFRCGKSF